MLRSPTWTPEVVSFWRNEREFGERIPTESLKDKELKESFKGPKETWSIFSEDLEVIKIEIRRLPTGIWKQTIFRKKVIDKR